jgi:Tfp pilus assembly protein PilF
MRFTYFILFSLLTLSCSSDADSWLEGAKKRLKAGETVSAKEAIKKAIEKNPGLAEAYNLQGVILFQEKDLAGAEIQYRKAIELKPSLVQAQLNLGALLMENGKWKDAFLPTNEAVKLQPDSSAAYLQRGIVLAALGKPAEAKADFTRCLQIAPNEINALYNRGNIYFQELNYPEAIRDFEASVTTNTEFGKGYYALGLSYYYVKEKEKSCLALQQAKKLKYPGASQAVKNLCNE